MTLHHARVTIIQLGYFVVHLECLSTELAGGVIITSTGPSFFRYMQKLFIKLNPST